MKKKPILKGRGLAAAVVAGVGVLGAGLWYPLHSQGIGNIIAPPVNALNVVGVPDANNIGLLEGNAAQGWPKITNTGKKAALVKLGKALFWDMQVGGDGIQACASCHYHAGADHRNIGQMSPGFKGGDFTQDLVTNNTPLTTAHYGLATNRGIPVSEAAKIANGNTPDATDGAPGTQGTRPDPAVDVNDVVSSQGPRNGTYAGLSGGRVDRATLSPTDPGFELNFPANAPGVPDTVRRVEPRNSPTVLNAVYNLRNFWDGRADPFFNGRNPLGFRDPSARVPTWNGAIVVNEQLMIPLSSLASQAVGPIGSDFEMVFGPRPVMDLGKKLVGAQPLAGQLIAGSDPVLGSGVDVRGLPGTYAAMITDIFDARFHNPLAGCLDANGAAADCGPTTYTLMEYNFPLFFGLAVQAYEATLTTEQTILDLIVGGVATGNVTNGARVVNVTGLSLEACVAAVRLNTGQAQGVIATNLCNNHYAKFIHPGARSGTESNSTATPIPANSPIGGCANPLTCASSPNQANGVATLTSVGRGLGRFFAGATACSVCHFNPEFTGATVSVITGFGAGPGEPLPPGQVRKVLERRVAMERMVAFNGLPTVYDTGFYNIGVRPTPEDISLGDKIGDLGNEFDLSFAKLLQDNLPLGAANTAREAAIGALIPSLRWPTGTNNLTPVPFAQFLTVFCGPGINNPNGNGNNNPAPQCNTGLVEGERILRNGAFKAPGLRNVKFTGPYFHNGGKLNLRQVVEFYKENGQFETLNFNNLDAGMRVFNLGVTDEASVVELLETGLTDWRVAFESGKFSHPELCIPNGHDPATGETIVAGLPAVGNGGSTVALQTFQGHIDTPAAGAHSLAEACTVPGIAGPTGRSLIDVPPAPLP